MKIKLGIGLILVMALLSGCSVPPPKIREIPDFKLIERAGTPMTKRDLLGSVTVVDFIFTHCAGSCPVMTGQMGRLQKKWDGKGVRFWSITVDPKRDTPAHLRDYAKEAGAGEGWFFLTGDKKAIFELAEKGFNLSAQDDSDPQPGFEVMHSTRFVLVDRRGFVRGYYDGTDEVQFAKLEKDLKSVLKEKP